MSENKLRTEVHFRSPAFNMTEPKEYFINDCCFGDDLCKWLMRELRTKNVRVDDEPGQEDFGWYFGFAVGGVKHSFVVGLQPEGEGNGLWRGWLERDAGFIGSMLGGRKRGILLEAAETIHGVLSGSDKIRDVTWHFAHAADDNQGTARPTG